MLNIYITNLGKYNEGELVGEWVKLPATEEELEVVYERIGINEEYEEMFITDYETDIEGLKVGEYDSIEDLNELADTLEGMDKYEEKALQAYLLNGCEFLEAVEEVEKGDYTIYSNCDNMTDVAYEVVEECGYLQNVPENVARYFDYEAFGRDLDIEGTFYNIGGDMVELF